MLELKSLCSFIVEVSAPLAVGTGPAGARSVSDIRAVTIEGDRLKGTLAGAAAADWMIRAGDLGIVDVRMTIGTDDGALIYMSYGGRMDLSNPAAGITASVAPVFETGDERYIWLNRIQAVGKGRLSMDGGVAKVNYELYEVL